MWVTQNNLNLFRFIMVGYLSKPVRPFTTGIRLLAISVAKFGIGLFPQAGIFFDISLHWHNPGSSPLLIRGVPGNDYLLTNSWAALLSGMVNITDPVGFYIFQLGLVIAALLSPFAMPSLSSCPERLWLLVLLLLAGPQDVVLLHWVGGYDALSVIGAVIASLARSLLVSTMGWGLLALNHPSIAIAAWFLWIPMKVSCTRALELRKRLLLISLCLVPISLGLLVNHLITQSWGGTTSRIEWLAHWEYSYYLENYLRALPAILWSLLGLGWLILIGTKLVTFIETRILLLTISLAGVLLPLIAIDESRVASIALLPAFLTYIRYVTIPKDGWLVDARSGWFALAAILMPTVLVFSRSSELYGWSWAWRLLQSIA